MQRPVDFLATMALRLKPLSREFLSRDRCLALGDCLGRRLRHFNQQPSSLLDHVDQLESVGPTPLAQTIRVGITFPDRPSSAG